ncbi:unnamed protein product, partial [Ranitomeya imitator]
FCADRKATFPILGLFSTFTHNDIVNDIVAFCDVATISLTKSLFVTATNDQAPAGRWLVAANDQDLYLVADHPLSSLHHGQVVSLVVIVGEERHVTAPEYIIAFFFLSLQKRRRRIDRSMIGEPTNFVHTAHVGSGDVFSGMNSVSSIQNQMQSKGGYGGNMSANVQMQLVDTKAG